MTKQKFEIVGGNYTSTADIPKDDDSSIIAWIAMALFRRFPTIMSAAIVAMCLSTKINGG
jgi:hypothetical protein